jgi:hypothetical protein
MESAVFEKPGMPTVAVRKASCVTCEKLHNVNLRTTAGNKLQLS